MIFEDDANQINSYTYEDWKPLLDLIPEIEKTSGFGEPVLSTELEEGVLSMPYYSERRIVSQFRDLAYEIPIIISFPWTEWEEGLAIVREKNFDFDTVDLVTKCKLLTAIVRNDKYCEGALVGAFESGLVLAVLKSIRKSVKTA